MASTFLDTILQSASGEETDVRGRLLMRLLPDRAAAFPDPDLEMSSQGCHYQEARTAQVLLRRMLSNTFPANEVGGMCANESQRYHGNFSLSSPRVHLASC
jgi:hypothetical protein